MIALDIRLFFGDHYLTKLTKMIQTENKVEELLRIIIASICRKTKTPKIELNESIHTFTVQVSSEDQGRAVGKKGLCFWAMNTILWYAGFAQNARPALMKLIEPSNGRSSSPPIPFKANANWDRKIIGDLIEAIMLTCFKTPGVWVIEDTGDGEATANVRIEKYLQTSTCDPSFEEALGIVLHAAGMAGGVAITTEVKWE